MTSQFENFQRSYVTWSGQLYKCDNVELVQKLVKLDYNTPATSGRRAAPRVCSRSNARWMSWPMQQMWIRSRYGS